jgi:hypothetical protein
LPIVEANPKDLFEPLLGADGKKHGDKLKAVSDLPRELAAAISRIKCDPESGEVVEIVLANKIEAGNVLLRSVGALIDRHEHTGSGGVPLAPTIIMTGRPEPETDHSALAGAKTGTRDA